MTEQSKNKSAIEEIMSSVDIPQSIALDCSSLHRGIDNYHIDVHLSDYFVLQAAAIIEVVRKRVVSGGKAITGGSDDIDNFRHAYVDMMRTTLHRAKMDLSRNDIRFLQFAVIKFVVVQSRLELDSVILQIEESIAQQQFAGSRSLLPTQEKLARFRKHYDEYLFRINRGIFQLLQREENGQLRELRRQMLGSDFSELVNIQFNPLLSAATPNDINVSIDSYSLWPKNGTGFVDFNNQVETLLKKNFLNLVQLELNPSHDLGASQSEVYDELNGLLAVQQFLGPCNDQADLVTEEFTWLEQPGNIRLLFDSSQHQRLLDNVKQDVGMKAQWDIKSEFKKLQKILQEIRKSTFSDAELKSSIAGHVLKEKWQLADRELIEQVQACCYIAGNEPKKILAKLDVNKDGFAALLKRLDELVDEVNRQYKEELDEKLIGLLSDYSRFRLHLKYFRFAHRLFNRIRIISSDEDIQLAKSGGKLYELLSSDEFKNTQVDESEVIHHAVLKADVRGSTTVIAELLKKNLNPASYFSLRFFDPITQLLEKYGAAKVFIEGDAVILSIYEKNHEPQQWYSVARSCGMAKDLLDIVRSKNAHSKQTGLPPLELGIGITFRNEKPMFLYDEGRAIMISSAIGDADQLSSCAWKLREKFEGQRFNVEVLAVDTDASEKGRDKIQYNVNGILLDNVAFTKLKSETSLKKVQIKLDGESVSLYVVNFPDIFGKERAFVIREGKVGIWQNDGITASDAGEKFYEVLPSSSLSNQILDLSKRA